MRRRLSASTGRAARFSRLRGFFDWDLAAPVTREWDLAFTAFAWVPLHARHIVQPEGFTAFSQRPRRLRLFLAEYGWTGDLAGSLRRCRPESEPQPRELTASRQKVIPSTNACGTRGWRSLCEQQLWKSMQPPSWPAEAPVVLREMWS